MPPIRASSNPTMSVVGDAVQADVASRRDGYLAAQRGTRPRGAWTGHDIGARRPRPGTPRHPVHTQATEVADCERGDLNPTSGRCSGTPTTTRCARASRRRSRSIVGLLDGWYWNPAAGTVRG